MSWWQYTTVIYGNPIRSADFEEIKSLPWNENPHIAAFIEKILLWGGEGEAFKVNNMLSDRVNLHSRTSFECLQSGN